jgi:tungstate transport system substrate-binding protein
LVAALAALPACTTSPQTLIVATTTSTADSGLLDEILPPFQDEANATVQVLAVGTGQALALGERGDADVILVHDREREDRFVAQGFGVERWDVMYNDFVLVGPPADPAGILGLSSAAEAFARIAQAGKLGQAIFVSRGDQSGTHSKTLKIWASAGIDPGGEWYGSTGQGMGETLTVANELLAYTLSDRGTYLSRAKGFNLQILTEGDELLFNEYGVIAVSRERHPDVKHDLAKRFIEYLTRSDTQERIGVFGVEEFGKPLFYPNSREWKAKP